MARTLLSQVLDGTGALSLLLKLRSHTQSPWLTVLTYHRVTHPVSAARVDDGVVDARPEAFEEQVAFLKRYCNVIGYGDLIRFRGGRSHRTRCWSPDDGYRDNRRGAAHPRPSRRPGHVLRGDAVRRSDASSGGTASHLVKHSPRTRCPWYPKRQTIRIGQNRKERLRGARRVMAVIKSHFELDLERYLDDVERASGVTLSREVERSFVDELLMSWDQVRALRAAGMSVQSHTREHRVLHTLSEASLQSELEGSKRDLEDVLGEPVSAVAYPVGKALHRAPHARNAIRRAGYEFGFTNGTGINALWRFDPIDVRRLSLELDVPASYFRGMVALPYFAYEPHSPSRPQEWS